MGGLYLRIISAVLVLGLITASFPNSTKAGALNAQISRSLQIIQTSATQLDLKFEVEVVYNGIGDDSKSIDNGTAKANFNSDVTNLRWRDNDGAKLSHEAKKAKLYKIDIPSFTPNSVSSDGETTNNMNLLWAEYLLAVINWTPDNIIDAPDISPRPTSQSLGTVALFFKKVGSTYYVSPDQSGIYRELLGTQEVLANSVQEALIAAINRSDPYIKVLDPSQANQSGKLDSNSAIQLLQNYEFTKLNVEDEANQSTDPKPPVMRLLKKTGKALKDALVFQFTGVTLVGGQTGSDNHFFWFKSRTNSNLWIVIDEDGDVIFTLADAMGSDTGKWLYGQLGSYGTPERNEKLTFDKSSFDSLIMHRVFNECNNAGECATLNFTKIVDYPDVQTKFGTGNVPWNHQIAVNSNGKNKNAWLNKWGVSYEDRQADGDIGGECSIFKIVSAGDIGAILSKMVDCLFTSIFRPMIDWATELVEDAAGVSYLPKVPVEKFYGVTA